MAYSRCCNKSDFWLGVVQRGGGRGGGAASVNDMFFFVVVDVTADTRLVKRSVCYHRDSFWVLSPLIH